MLDDIIYNRRKLYNRPALSLNDDQLKDLTLFEVEKFMRRLGSTLKRFENMPYPDEQSVSCSTNQLICDERSYDKEDLALQHRQQFAKLTDEQRNVYQHIMNVVDANDGGVFFVYGYGGTGKTFIWRMLSAAIRCQGEIVLNVASSGIASLLLDGGRTTHSRFRIPINLNEDSMCNINADSDVAMLMRKCKLIIWDEAPMVHKHAFEALDRTLKDILSTNEPRNADKPFGGKVVVFGGDFRQILPVIPKGYRNDIVNATLNSSYIWQHCRVLKLTVNMRLKVGSQFSNIEETKQFAEWILNIGEGNEGGSNDGESDVEIPEDLLIRDTSDPVGSIIEFAYPNVGCLNLLKETVYLSSDIVCESEFAHNGFENALYSPDVLNGLKFASLPNHKLVLKVGVPIMLLRNIDQTGGLCNGMMLQVVKLGQRIIEAEIISGSNIGSRILIPRMRLCPTDKNMPFKMYRRQFPVVVCFAMTINKSQGQSLSRVGLFLPRPVFTHGQLYVALSRVKSRNGLKILISDKDGALTTKTSNVVYKEVLANV